MKRAWVLCLIFAVILFGGFYLTADALPPPPGGTGQVNTRYLHWVYAEKGTNVRWGLECEASHTYTSPRVVYLNMDMWHYHVNNDAWTKCINKDTANTGTTALSANTWAAIGIGFATYDKGTIWSGNTYGLAQAGNDDNQTDAIFSATNCTPRNITQEYYNYSNSAYGSIDLTQTYPGTTDVYKGDTIRMQCEYEYTFEDAESYMYPNVPDEDEQPEIELQLWSYQLEQWHDKQLALSLGDEAGCSGAPDGIRGAFPITYVIPSDLASQYISPLNNIIIRTVIRQSADDGATVFEMRSSHIDLHILN